MHRSLGRLLVIAATLAASKDAAAWVDAHVTGMDVRVQIAQDGAATMTQDIAYHVQAGTLRSFTLASFDDDAWHAHPTAAILGAAGGGAQLLLSTQDHALHVTVDDPKGLKHGDVKFELVYEGTVRATRDGALDRLWVTLPPVHEGLDSAHVVMLLPTAPTEPRAATDGDTAQDVVTVTRGPDHDQVDLVRPHVAKGEPATFSVRVDPKAVPQLDATLPKPAAPVAVVADPVLAPPELGDLALVAASVLALLALGMMKGRALQSRSSENPSGMLPGSCAVRTVLAALLLGGGVFEQQRDHLMLGAAFVAASLPLLAWRFRASPVKHAGSWRPACEGEAFVRATSVADYLDATTRPGLVVLAAALGVVAITGWVARAVGALPLIAIDAFVLAPIFFTGTSRQLGGRNAEVLAPLSRVLAEHEQLGVTPILSGSELRLLVTPSIPMPGAMGIEVAVAWESAGASTLPWLDVLVRVQDDTFAAAKMTAAFPKRRVLPGRKPEERVYRFAPDWPTGKSAIARVVELAEVLRDRRFHVAPRPEAGAGERRLPPNKRLAA